MNPMLDGYPSEYNGYLIRTDYRIGIQICQCLADTDLNPYEQTAIALNLLYGNGVPVEPDIAYAGLAWFLHGGKENQETSSDEEECFDFDIDSGRIITGFRRAYGVDIDKIDMHWFRFLAMIGDLGECAFTNVIDYRTKKITADMPAETRKTYSELKRRYALKPTYTDEEQEMIEQFLSSLEK